MWADRSRREDAINSVSRPGCHDCCVLLYQRVLWCGLEQGGVGSWRRWVGVEGAVLSKVDNLRRWAQITICFMPSCICKVYPVIFGALGLHVVPEKMRQSKVRCHKMRNSVKETPHLFVLFFNSTSSLILCIIMLILYLAFCCLKCSDTGAGTYLTPDFRYWIWYQNVTFLTAYFKKYKHLFFSF